MMDLQYLEACLILLKKDLCTLDDFYLSRNFSNIFCVSL